MEHVILSLVSGLIGAIIGAGGALWINSTNHRVAAIEKMISLVYPIGFRSWYEPEEGKPDKIFYDSYSELWGAYAALRAALPWWKRKGLDKAWQQYAAIEYYDEIPEDEYSKIFQRGTHISKREAVERSSEFVRYLLKLRHHNYFHGLYRWCRAHLPGGTTTT
jgi:hypothetical protein